MGPNCVTGYREFKALGILLDYLTNTSLSPLQRDMVEIEDPYVSEISAYANHFLESLLIFTFNNAPIKKIDSILDKFKDILIKVSNEEKIDMHRMKSIIDKVFLEDLSALESDPHLTVAKLLVKDAVYGNNESDVSILIISFN